MGVSTAYLAGVWKSKWDGLCKRQLTHFKVSTGGSDDKDEGMLQQTCTVCSFMLSPESCQFLLFNGLMLHFPIADYVPANENLTFNY